MKLFKVIHRIVLLPDGRFYPNSKCFPCGWTCWGNMVTGETLSFETKKEAESFVEEAIKNTKEGYKPVKVVASYEH